MKFVFDINPCAAPRLSQRDRWQPSKAASKYYGFRNHLCYLANLKSLDGLPDSIESIIFHVPMPQSWSKRKREQMNSTPHQQTPDLDNLCKAFLDALCPSDQHIHSIGNMKKVWSESGQITLTIDQEQEEIANYGSNIYREM